jgi:hypothetical protein
MGWDVMHGERALFRPASLAGVPVSADGFGSRCSPFRAVPDARVEARVALFDDGWCAAWHRPRRISLAMTAAPHEMQIFASGLTRT